MSCSLKKLFCGVGLVAFTFTSPLCAQEVPEIKVSAKSVFDLAISPLQGPAGKQATAILTKDLNLSNWFNLTGASPSAYRVAGGASGSQVDGKLVAPGGRVLFQKTYSGNSLSRNVHRFSDDIVKAITGRPGIAASTIVFVSNRSGRKELFLCDYLGGSVRQVTRDGSICASPSISARGDRIVYTSYRSGYADIYAIDLPSGRRQRIIKEPGTNTGATLSPDGRKIALTMSSAGNPELYVTDANGRGARRLTKTQGVESSPTWAPDNSQIIFCSDDRGSPQLYGISASGGSARPIGTGFNYCTEPSWSPDGRLLAFNVRRGGSLVIAVYDFSSNRSQVITTGANAEDPAWGADSRHLVYTQDSAIWLHDYQTGKRRQLVGNMRQVFEPGWTR